MNSLFQDYKGSTSFTRVMVLLIVLAALAALYGANKFASDRYLHGFDKLLEAAVLIFLSGKGPELVEAGKTVVGSWIEKVKSGTASPCEAPQAPAPVEK